MIDIKKIQSEIVENKTEKGFNTTDVTLEFAKMYGEMGEAFDAYLKKMPDLGEELADVAIFLFSIATMTKVDLEKEIEKKMQKNKDRTYIKVDGVFKRVDKKS